MAIKQTKTSKLLSTLEKGKTVTFAQMQNSFNLGNPYDAVRVLRQNGFAIVTDKNKSGKTTYSLDSIPSKNSTLSEAIVALYGKSRSNRVTNEMISEVYNQFGGTVFTRG